MRPAPPAQVLLSTALSYARSLGLSAGHPAEGVRGGCLVVCFHNLATWWSEAGGLRQGRAGQGRRLVKGTAPHALVRAWFVFSMPVS